MRWSKTFIPTMKEVPADAEIPSHQLMLRAGLIRQLMAGAYTYLPLGWRAVRKAEAIVREEMERADAVEIFMPALQPIELFERTGRREAFGNVLINFNVRRRDHDVHLALGPTHEEVVTDLASRHISSYRQLPITLFQIQTKFRNEERPRFGVLRTSEFIMKDAYSFDASLEQLNESYEAMYQAYCRIFARCGLEYRAIEAESGPIGGSASHEFMVLTPNGEDVVLATDKGDYAANREKCEIGDREHNLYGPRKGEKREIPTPDCTSIAELCALWPKVGGGKLKQKDTLKTLLFKVSAISQESRGYPFYWLVVLRGDHELNEGKLRTAFQELHPDDVQFELIDEDEARKLGFQVGYLGPDAVHGLDSKVGERTKLLIDPDAAQSKFWVVGANKPGYHVANFNWQEDCLEFEGPWLYEKIITVKDIRNAIDGDPSPRDDGVLRESRGIEVGHVFKLGTKYSEALGAEFLDEKEQRHPLIMGCYGIGVNRIVAAAAETLHDENGLLWPLAIAPYSVLVIPLNMDDKEVLSTAEGIYNDLTEAGVDVLYDDRAQRPGFKFKDADLVGIPLRIVIGGRGLKDGVVEIKWRTDADPQKIPVGDATQYALDQLADRRAKENSCVPGESRS